MQKRFTLALVSPKPLLFYGNRQILRLIFTMALSISNSDLLGNYKKDVECPYSSATNTVSLVEKEHYTA